MRTYYSSMLGDIGSQFGQLYRNMTGNQTLKFFKYSWRHSELAEEVTSVK